MTETDRQTGNHRRTGGVCVWVVAVTINRSIDPCLVSSLVGWIIATRACHHTNLGCRVVMGVSWRDMGKWREGGMHGGWVMDNAAAVLTICFDGWLATVHCGAGMSDHSLAGVTRLVPDIMPSHWTGGRLSNCIKKGCAHRR